jgi:hypothetical protein
MAWFFVRFLRPRLDVVIGLDGMRVRGRLGTRFVPWSEVREVTAGRGSFQVLRQDGRVETFWCDPDDPKVLFAVVGRCQDALEVWRRAEGASDPCTALDRNGRALAQWREDLGKILRTVGDYRTAVLSRERVEAVLADPSTTAERRLAAALTLAQTDDAGGRARVRVAADVCANETERKALTHIAEGAEGDGPLEAALAQERGGG